MRLFKLIIITLLFTANLAFADKLYNMLITNKLGNGYIEIYKPASGYGVMTENYKIIIAPVYQDIMRVGNYFLVSNYDNTGNIATLQGKLISPKSYMRVYTFVNGFAKVFFAERKMGYLTKQGTILGNQSFYDGENFSHGVAVVKNDDYDFNYLSSTGRLLCHKWLDVDSASSFKSDYALLTLSNNTNKIINRHCQIIPLPFKHLSAIGDNKAAVKTSCGFKFIDIKNAALISNTCFKRVKPFSENGLAIVVNKAGRYNYLQANGHYLLNHWYQYLYEFDDDSGFAIIKEHNHCLQHLSVLRVMFIKTALI